MYLCLDLSSKCTGWAKFSKDGKLIKKGRITPDPKLHPYKRLQYVTDQVKPLFEGIDTLIIEGLYVGINPKAVLYLARLSGAVMYAWMSYKFTIPFIYNASSARKLAGVNGRAHKAEVQLHILKLYKFASDIKIKEYNRTLNQLISDFKEKEITKGQFKYRLDKLSKLIDKETGIGEDIADSIILGIAHHKKGKTNV